MTAIGTSARAARGVSAPVSQTYSDRSGLAANTQYKYAAHTDASCSDRVTSFATFTTLREQVSVSNLDVSGSGSEFDFGIKVNKEFWYATRLQNGTARQRLRPGERHRQTGRRVPHHVRRRGQTLHGQRELASERPAGNAHRFRRRPIPATLPSIVRPATATIATWRPTLSTTSRSA